MAMDRQRAAVVSSPDLVLPSRSAALAACREVIEVGPVLITGAAGVGKTRLVHRLQQETRLSWACVDVSPGMPVAEFLTSILVTMGETNPGELARVALSRVLADRSGDGRRIGLIVDEAHGASDAILEEVRRLSNRFGMADGFAAMILCGQTPLARRVETRAMDGLESRLAGRVHLLPLDDRETRMWAESRLGGTSLAEDVLEDLARETGGIPSKIERMIVSLKGIRHGGSSSVAVAPPISPREQPAERLASPSLLPAKPPLYVDDGMIEVGWDAEDEGESDEEPVDVDVETVSELSETEDEPIDDHYAALQAWDESGQEPGPSPRSIRMRMRIWKSLPRTVTPPTRTPAKPRHWTRSRAPGRKGARGSGRTASFLPGLAASRGASRGVRESPRPSTTPGLRRFEPSVARARPWRGFESRHAPARPRLGTHQNFLKKQLVQRGGDCR